MVKRLFIATFVAISPLLAAAQNLITGHITDARTGDPLIGASVIVKNESGKGVVTGLDGNFSLQTKVEAPLTLRVEYVGYRPLDVDVYDFEEPVEIQLTENINLLDGVVITVPYGQAKKSSFTGSASVVSSDDLSKKITTNVADALVGSVPGLQIRGASGQPGASQGAIKIRGISSIYASSDPLVIVDGAPYSASLSNIPQDDIESVTVLKDAASAALYGARGAAGVILITTKKGKTQKALVNVDMKWGPNSRAIQDYETITDPAQFMEACYMQF
jgi:TonB-dependent SusC/RagA subfamily outer membrane receptor